MKKLIICTLALSLLLCLSACESTQTETTEPTAPSTTETIPEPPQKILEERIVDGRSRCTAIYQYDAQDRVIRIDRTHDSDGSIYNYETFEYDEKGNILMEEKWLNDEVPASRTSYEYGETGLLLRINHEKVHEAVWNWYAVTLDAHGRIEKYDVYEIYRDNDIPAGQILFTYDAQGNLLRQEQYDTKEVLISTVDYTYDELGQLTQVVTFTQGTNFDTKTTDTYEYNEKGQCITKIHEIYSDDMPFSTVKTAYIWG